LRLAFVCSLIVPRPYPDGPARILRAGLPGLHLELREL